MWMRSDTQSQPPRKRARAFMTGSDALALAATLLLALVLSVSPLGASMAAADAYKTSFDNSTYNSSTYDNAAARVNSTVRPCFGMLLDSQLRTCGPQRHYREAGDLYGYHGHGRADAVINCDTATEGYVEEVAEHIRAGGVLYLKARNRSCIASLNITRSLTIVGEGYGAQQIPGLVAPDGESCIHVAPTAVHVILKNMYISSPRGEQAACVEAANTELTIQNTEIRYQGDNAAVHLAGGRLNLTESSHLIAKTRSVALAINNAQLYAENSEIATTSGGIYAVLDGDSQILGVSVQQLADWHGFERGEGAIGLEIKLDSAGSILTMNDMKVLYFSEGINLDGAGEALLSHTLVARSDHGITASLNRIRVIENTIIANEIGIDVQSGTAYVGRNQIANIRTAGILATSDGEIRAVDNEVDPNGGGCPTLRWGNIDPSQRVCTPWYKGSEFDVPGDANDQYLFDQFWPRMNEVAMDTARTPDTTVPLNKPDAAHP